MTPVRRSLGFVGLVFPIALLSDIVVDFQSVFESSHPLYFSGVDSCVLDDCNDIIPVFEASFRWMRGFDHSQLRQYE